MVIQFLIGFAESPTRAFIDGNIGINFLAINEARHVFHVQLKTLARDEKFIAFAMLFRFCTPLFFHWRPAFIDDVANSRHCKPTVPIALKKGLNHGGAITITP